MLYNHYNNNYSNSELSLTNITKIFCFLHGNYNDILIRVTVHRTDTVSIIVACTLKPIPINYDGISKFTEINKN